VVPIIELDVLRAELAARGRAVTIERIEAGDHSMNRPGLPQPGISEVFTHVLDWSLK
jgi:hypothetical protein